MLSILAPTCAINKKGTKIHTGAQGKQATKGGLSHLSNLSNVLQGGGKAKQQQETPQEEKKSEEKQMISHA